MSSKKNKIVMLGDSGVGKTSLVKRWINNTYKGDQLPTIGAAYTQNIVNINNESYKIQVWDTAGEEKYRSMAPIYCQGAFGAMIVFDFLVKESFDSINSWVSCLDNTGGNIPIVICGNKVDLLEDETKLIETCQKLNEMGYTFFATSASTGTHVEEAFMELIRRAIEFRKQESETETVVQDIQQPPEEKGGCC
ncbi:Ras-related protein Rab-22A [Histomonas meleagridis]|uniref:Ras-related protein Rab-22A n=1 Tax=Histomonas meleagridis TaxID=135588 RepID=UPI00355A0BAC|nr:Ras-related protein Rab-22A [Histomonas meleagridis]KAH0797225.1 Ras-related protein Rab-22A [Histomonas meleagridis]